MIKKFIALFFVFCSTSSFAQSVISLGEYISEGGWGDLIIKKNLDGSLQFNINSMGSNGHTCEVSGVINKGIANVNPEPDEKCSIKFKNTSSGIEVTPDGDGCRYYCGMRATFDGEYLKVANECLPLNIDKARKEHLKLYKEKKYNEALAYLEPVFNNCSKTLFWIEKARIQNDLAVTYAKVNKFKECSKILSPLKEDAKMTQEELKENYPPLEAEVYWPIIKSTKTNMKLCNIK